MPLAGCSHRPPCPTTSSRFVCGQRTRIEDAVNRGLVARQAGWTLLSKYGVPMSPIRKVVTGAKPPLLQEKFEL